MTSVSPPVYNGRYELVRQVARGGMAEVYLAKDLLLDRPVALKVLFPELSVDRSFVARFRREAQAAANLSHPNIVSIFDWGEADRTYFIVMEYVDGRPLSALLAAEGPLPADRAAGIGAEVAAALSYAHRHGVVHRDVKPGNVLIANDGAVKVADFGIARAANADENLTQTGAVMGTATYFSPEQAQGEGVDARSDVYSLGVVLYEMVTGGPPFNGDSPLSIAYKHVREEPVPPTGRNPAVPPAYEAVVLHAMAKSPAARYQSAEELRSDLLAFRQGRAIAAPPTVVGGAPTTAVQSATAEAGTTRVQPRARTVVVEDEGYEEEEEKPSRTGLWAILLLVLLAAIAVVVYFVLQSLGLLPGTLSSTETVPSVTGQPVAQAITTLQNDHLSPKVVKAVHAGTPVGNVYGQSPNAGTTLHRGDTVTLDVAKAKTQVGVPKVVGQQYTNAQSALTAKGFKVTQTPKQSSQPKGQVLAQSTPGGQQAPKGSTITLTVSSGPGTIPVPPVVGDTASRASYILGQKGLSLGTNTPQPSTKYPAGQVISTSPPVGQAVAPGTKVDLTVSSGKPTATVPPVTGETQSAASNALTNAGFNPQVTYQTVTDPTQDGIVQSETPAANSTQPKGTTVTIVVGQYTAPPSTTAKPTTTSTTTTSTTTTSTTTPPSSTTAPSSTTVPPGTPTSSPPTT